jgi:hypothetical protein
MEDERKARADYFTPGNIVQSYGDIDEVLSYTPPKEDGGGWSVKVHAVNKVNGEWVRIGKPQDARTHSTQPDAQALKSGPLDKVKPAAAANVPQPAQPGTQASQTPSTQGAAPAVGDTSAPVGTAVATEPWKMTRKEYAQQGGDISYSSEGSGSHRGFVEAAVSRGETISPEVLKDYPWIAADQNIKPYADGLRNLSDNELRSEEKRATDALNKWANKTPAINKDGGEISINPQLHTVDSFEVSARFNAVNNEIERRKDNPNEAPTSGPVARPETPAATESVAKPDDFDAMFDDVLAEEVAKDQAKTEKPKNLKQAIAKHRAAKAPRTAKKAATSAAKNVGSALNNAIDGLGALFGQTPSDDGTTNLNSGVPVKFNAETYAKAKPLFQAAIADMGEAGKDLKEAMRAVIRMVLDKFGAQAAGNMKPYVMRFIEDRMAKASKPDNSVKVEAKEGSDAAQWDALPEKERSFLVRGVSSSDISRAMHGDWSSLTESHREIAKRIIANNQTLIRALTSGIVSPDEYPTAEVAKSYDHISHYPSDAAMVDRNAFLKTIQSEYDLAFPVAETDEQKAVLKGEIEALKVEYMRRESSFMGVRGNTYSSLISGRGNLDSKGYQRRNSSLDRSAAKFSDWVNAIEGGVKEAVEAAKNADQRAADQQAKDEKAAKRHASEKKHVSALLNFVKGDGSKFGNYPIARVTMDRDGYPSSVTVDANDLTDNKFDVAKTLFGGDKDKLRAMVDEIRADSAPAKPDNSVKVEAKAEIADFGEVLPGARKDAAPSLKTELSDNDIAAQPLSKIWPADEYLSIDDKFASAISFAARAEIPAKPRTSYRVKNWVEKVKTVRNIAQRITSGSVTSERMAEELAKTRSLSAFSDKVALLEAIDREHWGRIDSVEVYPDAYRYNEDGTQTKTPLVRVSIDGRSRSFDGATSVADVVERVIAMVDTEQQQTKKMQFEVRGTESKGFGINKKGDKEYRKLKTFPTAKEAFEFIKTGYDDLVAEWDGVKDRDNVKKDDVRGTENRPRTAKDYRNGKDVTSEQFAETFGFRGGQFGKWVNQGEGRKDRQGMLNQAYDALMDLADIVGIPPRAVSLNGTLGLAFGARGSGTASAHYEPDTLVINLTKTRGAVLPWRTVPGEPESVERLANGIASHWENAPKIVVAFDMNDPIIPDSVRKEDQRQRSGGATGTPEGFFYKGTVYLMSSKLGTPDDIARVLFHEHSVTTAYVDYLEGVEACPE